MHGTHDPKEIHNGAVSESVLALDCRDEAFAL